MGAHTISRSEAAREAGLSKHQKDTALRVANVAPEVFEALVESDAPPTVTALADMGRTPRARLTYTEDRAGAHITLFPRARV